ncbi:hypothetical protein [Gloeothece citriformis]|uniref:hypothetical protein n=1 Tax=Gloeothece citriformis TaxID=2546356 RepID=UPI0012FEDAF4|nr:hypothetical protein [Gloeothece citriformis]
MFILIQNPHWWEGSADQNLRTRIVKGLWSEQVPTFKRPVVAQTIIRASVFVSYKNYPRA